MRQSADHFFLPDGMTVSGQPRIDRGATIGGIATHSVESVPTAGEC
ncbi:hypothetical protein ATKI12_2136 [Kitasatospora sp. Ki12]